MHACIRGVRNRSIVESQVKLLGIDFIQQRQGLPGNIRSGGSGGEQVIEITQPETENGLIP